MFRRWNMLNLAYKYGKNISFKNNLLTKLNKVSILPNTVKNNLISLPSYFFSNKINHNAVEEYNPYANKEKLESNTLIRRVQKEEENALSFKEFKFIPEMYYALDQLKLIAPTSIQSVAIPKIMEKKHIFYSSQTGTGKTLTYVLPLINELKIREKEAGKRLTLVRRPRALIIVPSRELAQQVEEVIKLFVYDVPLVVESFYVGKSFTKEKVEAARGMDILITTPERFKNHWDKHNIYSSKLTHLVVDELDTLLDSGNEEFLKMIAQIMLEKNQKEDLEVADSSETPDEKNKVVSRQLIYASATLTPSIDNYLKEIFSQRADFIKIIDKSTNHNLSNVKHEFLHLADYDKYPTLLKILDDNSKLFKQNLSIIIFCNNVSCARKTEMFLAENKYQTACLHGDIPPFRRKFELEKFKARRAKILVCTDLIARGLDFPFVFLVINFDFPRTLSDYLHRAGRTGRNGARGNVVSFYRKNNLFIIEKIKKAHQLNLPMDVQNSIYNLRKNITDGNKLYADVNKKLTPSVKEKTLNQNNEVATIKRLRKRKEAFEKYRLRNQPTRENLIRKINESNSRKMKLKSNNKNSRYVPFSTARPGKKKFFANANKK